MSAKLGRDFRLLWLGQAASQLGDRIHQIAMAWWVLQTTGSAAMMGALLVASSVPAIVLGPVAGPLADRMDRKTLMLACDLGRGALVTLMALLAVRHALSVPWLFVFAVVLASLGAVFMPASLAVVPSIVAEDSLLRANSLQEMTAQTAGILGPALGGLLVAGFGAPAAFGANAASFALSAVLLASMRRQPAPKSLRAESYLDSLRAGLGCLRSRPALTSLLGAFAVANLFLAPIPVLLPVFARSVFACGASGLGYLEGALGCGMVASALFLSRGKDIRHKVALIALSFVVQGGFLAGMGLHPDFNGFLVGLFALGSALSALNVVCLSAFQRAIPGEQLGRFMGLLGAIVLGVMPLSYAAVGLLSARYSAGSLWAVSGALLILVGVFLTMLPGLRGFEAEIAPG